MVGISLLLQTRQALLPTRGRHPAIDARFSYGSPTVTACTGRSAQLAKTRNFGVQIPRRPGSLPRLPSEKDLYPSLLIADGSRPWTSSEFPFFLLFSQQMLMKQDLIYAFESQFASPHFRKEPNQVLISSSSERAHRTSRPCAVCGRT